MSAAVKSRIALLLVSYVGTLIGCQTMSIRLPVERLDTGSGVTITNARDVMVFARTEPRYSRSARDYIYLGPIETNRQGLREYFLWIGIATTLDRGFFLAPDLTLPSRLELIVRGEPMEFELLPWPPPYLSESLSSIYATPVPPRGSLAARVTLDQLHLLNNENPPSIIVYGAGDDGRRFEMWSSSSQWDEFLGARR